MKIAKRWNIVNLAASVTIFATTTVAVGCASARPTPTEYCELTPHSSTSSSDQVPATVLARALIVERASGSVLIADQMSLQVICRIDGLGDLSHASAVFSPDARWAYVFGRDGGLNQVDMLDCKLHKRIVQSGNAIGGAISTRGDVIAVSNYVPGGVRLFAANDLEMLADIAASTVNGTSKTVGLVDIPGNDFMLALFDGSEIWHIALPDVGPINNETLRINRMPSGDRPYDATVTPDGRYFLAGLFGENGVEVVDLWQQPLQNKRILNEFAATERLPVYKMPHFGGIGMLGSQIYMPAVGAHEVWGLDPATWKLKSRYAVKGQPVFVVPEPGSYRLWVNFALPDNQWVQVLDIRDGSILHTLELGVAVLHMEFSGRGDRVWLSVRDEQRVVVLDTKTMKPVGEIQANAPSGIFFAGRAQRTGQ